MSEEKQINQTPPATTTGGVEVKETKEVPVVEPKVEVQVKQKAEDMEGRNSDGTFKEGGVGNPTGRPKGTFGLGTILKKKLQEVPLGQVKEYGDQVIEKLLELAIVNGDSKAIKLILNYADGLPRATIGIDGGEEGQPVKISVETQSLVNEALSKFLGAKK